MPSLYTIGLVFSIRLQNFIALAILEPSPAAGRGHKEPRGFEQMAKVISLGELLIDSTPVGLSAQGHPLYEANPGGAPANMLACMAKLGNEAYLFGCVGKDGYGQFLLNSLEKNGISAKYMKQSQDQLTTLDVVTIYEDGDRDFVFYRNPGADTQIAPEDVRPEAFEGAALFHFGSLSLTHEPARSATLRALDLAREKGCLISYDPNLRPPLWPSLDRAREAMLSVMDRADVLKVSQEEAEFLTGLADPDAAADRLLGGYPLRLIFITLGAEGCRYYSRAGLRGAAPGIRKGGVKDTTGSGDYFFGGALDALLRLNTPIEKLSGQQLRALAEQGNRCGYLVATQTGALGAKLSRRMLEEL